MPQHLNHKSPRRRRQKGHEKILQEIIARNLGNSDTSPRNPESPKQDKPKVKHPKTHINQINKDQTQRTNIKSSKGETANNTQGDWITADLSIETLQARREWQDILKVMKENNLQPRLLYPAWISFRYKGEFESFIDKQKLREFSTTKPALQQMLKNLL